jgi:hypothetical protein
VTGHPLNRTIHPDQPALRTEPCLDPEREIGDGVKASFALAQRHHTLFERLHHLVEGARKPGQRIIAMYRQWLDGFCAAQGNGPLFDAGHAVEHASQHPAGEQHMQRQQCQTKRNRYIAQHSDRLFEFGKVRTGTELTQRHTMTRQTKIDTEIISTTPALQAGTQIRMRRAECGRPAVGDQHATGTVPDFEIFSRSPRTRSTETSRASCCGLFWRMSATGAAACRSPADRCASPRATPDGRRCGQVDEGQPAQQNNTEQPLTKRAVSTAGRRIAGA